MGSNREVNRLAAQEMFHKWGGRWPAWTEFQEARQRGRVSVNRSVAARAIHSRCVPAGFRILFGVIVAWFGFLAIPVSATFCLLAGVSPWWILPALAIGPFLVAVSRDGHCEGILIGAERNEDFYKAMIENGAFLFEPTTTKP